MCDYGTHRIAQCISTICILYYTISGVPTNTVKHTKKIDDNIITRVVWPATRLLYAYLSKFAIHAQTHDKRAIVHKYAFMENHILSNAHGRYGEIGSLNCGIIINASLLLPNVVTRILCTV